MSAFVQPRSCQSSLLATRPRGVTVTPLLGIGPLGMLPASIPAASAETLWQEVCVEPAAPGLDLICEGVRLISPDDATAIQRGAMVYDALYERLKQAM